MHVPVNELRAYAHAMIHTAATWDVLGTAGLLPAWWPPVSYVLAALAIAAACLAALLVMLTARTSGRAVGHGPGGDGTPRVRARVGTGGQLLAIGILLIAWMLRGHAEIPPDAPLVAAEVLAAALYAVFTLRRRMVTDSGA